METTRQYRYVPRNEKEERRYTVGYSYTRNLKKARRQKIFDKVLWAIIIVMICLLAAGLVNDFIIQPKLRDAVLLQDSSDRAMLDRLLTSYRNGSHHFLSEGETLPGIEKLMYYSLDEYDGVEYVVMATYSGWIYAGPVKEYSYLNGIQLLDQHQYDDLLGKNK